MSKKKKIKFTLNPHEIYDGVLPQNDWPIGIKASYPDILLKNITASSIACRMGVESVDYIRKRYLENWSKDELGFDDKSPDLVTVHSLRNKIKTLEDFVVENSHNLILSSSQQIVDITLVKALGTINIALDLSSKGLLHEVLLLSRTSLEMISWSNNIFIYLKIKTLMILSQKKHSLALRKFILS